MEQARERFARYDTADYLLTPEDIDAYLVACAEVGDRELLRAALADAARALDRGTPGAGG